jgi:hypothetical protein
MKLSRQAQYRAKPWFITNPDFDNDSAWAKGDDWTIDPSAPTIAPCTVDFYVNGEWVGRIE